jgi:ABC-2 type transport system ATP-binding protein
MTGAVMAATDAMTTGTRAPGTDAIAVTGVTVRFRRRGREPFTALDDVTLRVPAGAVTCLLGPNGSGKTTLMNVLTGLSEPSEGQVDVLGRDPRRQRADVLRRIALVPQETSVYPELTARENLTFHAEYYGMPRAGVRDGVSEALDLVQLSSRADDAAGTFSGGMQRRLALAKALMMHPEVLLLDEPTLGVDVQSREAIWQRIEQTAADGRSVLLTTNYMEEAERLGDRIVIIDRGRNVVDGTRRALTAALPLPPVRVEFDSPEIARQVAAGVGRGAVTADGTVVTLHPAGADDAAGGLADLLVAADRRHVVGIHAPQPGLQDVFLHHTGRDLRD